MKERSQQRLVGLAGFTDCRAGSGSGLDVFTWIGKWLAKLTTPLGRGRVEYSCTDSGAHVGEGPLNHEPAGHRARDKGSELATHPGQELVEGGCRIV